MVESNSIESLEGRCLLSSGPGLGGEALRRPDFGPRGEGRTLQVPVACFVEYRHLEIGPIQEDVAAPTRTRAVDWDGTPRVFDRGHIDLDRGDIVIVERADGRIIIEVIRDRGGLRAVGVSGAGDHRPAAQPAPSGPTQSTDDHAASGANHNTGSPSSPSGGVKLYALRDNPRRPARDGVPEAQTASVRPPSVNPAVAPAPVDTVPEGFLVVGTLVVRPGTISGTAAGSLKGMLAADDTVGSTLAAPAANVTQPSLTRSAMDFAGRAALFISGLSPTDKTAWTLHGFGVAPDGGVESTAPVASAPVLAPLAAMGQAILPTSRICYIERIDPLAAFADSLSAFADEIMSVPATPPAPVGVWNLTGTLRAWAITLAVAAADLSLLGWVYWHRRQQRRRQQTVFAIGRRGLGLAE